MSLPMEYVHPLGVLFIWPVVLRSHPRKTCACLVGVRHPLSSLERGLFSMEFSLHLLLAWGIGVRALAQGRLVRGGGDSGGCKSARLGYRPGLPAFAAADFMGSGALASIICG